MGLTVAIDLLIENKACRGALVDVVSVVGWGAVAGLLGSLVSFTSSFFIRSAVLIGSCVA